MKEQTKYNWFIIFLLAFFISEAIYNIFLWEGLRYLRIAAFIKLLAQFYMGYIILIKRQAIKNEIILLILLFVIFIIGQLCLKNNINFFKNFEYFNNSIYIIIVLLFFKAIKLSNQQKEKALEYMQAIILINAIIAIIGFIFSIQYFKTYFNSRFGYDGLLMKSSYSSYLNLIALFYVFHKYYIANNLRVYILIIVVIGAVLSGTKSSLLALCLVIAYILFVKRVYTNYLFIGLSVSIIILLAYFNQNILQILQNNLTTFGPIIKKDGYITAITSFRDIILTEQLIPYVESNWSVLNYLFGGMGNVFIKSGFEIIDLVYFFGIIGGFVYLYLFKITFFPLTKSKEVIYICVLIVIISSFAGNFFYNSSLAIFLCGIKYYFEIYNANKNIKHADS